jgi:hypothetical protein
MPRKLAVVVLGPHRSGTSAVTRVISLLGADLPSVLMPVNPDNPSGFWESLHLMHIHDAMLASAGSSWQDISRLSPSWFGSDAAHGFEQTVAERLRRDFANSPLFVIKDPRICRLVPFWLRVLHSLDVGPAFVIPVRNPLEVAASLKNRDGFPLAQSLLLWLRHVLDAERDTRDQARSIVSYEHLLRNWRQVVDKMASDLGLSWPPRSALSDTEIDAFLSEEGRHHTYSSDELNARQDVADWVKRVYATFRTAADGGTLATHTLDSVRSELDASDLAFGPLLADNQLRLAGVRGELEAARTLVTVREADVAQLRSELDATAALLARQESETARVSQELEATKGALAAKHAEAAAVREELEATLADSQSIMEGLRSELIAARASGQIIVDSRSWKLTKPLRQLIEVLSYVGEIGLARTISLMLKRDFVKQLHLRRHLAVIEHSRMFDASWYVAQYPDVARANLEPMRHYLVLGAAEGRDPHPLFDTSWYLDRYPDVGHAGMNPLVHYILRGAMEGRHPHPHSR